MKRLTAWTFLAAFLVAPAVADAQITDAPRVPNASEYLQFVGGSGQGSYLDPAYQVGPYSAAFGSDPTATFSVICVDFNNYAGSQQVYAAGVEGGVGSLATTRLGSGSATTYRQTAYLASMFDTGQWESVSADRKTAWSAIHGAIWSITNSASGVGPSPVPTQGTQAGVVAGLISSLTSDAAAAVAGGYKANGWYVLSPAQGYDGQEFLVRTEVPEPVTYLLLATGLLLFAAFGRRRMSESLGA